MAEASSNLPSDHGAERAVLAAVLVDPVAFDDVRALVQADDFFDPRHRRIFSAFCAAEEEGKADEIDLVTVISRLDRDGTLAAAGGAEYLSGLGDGVSRAMNAAGYAEVVLEHSHRRRLHRLGTRIGRAAINEDAQQVLAQAEEGLQEIGEGAFRGGYESIAAGVEEVAREAQEFRADLPGVRTGFDELDELTGGLQPNDLILVAARPSRGKTSLALNIAYAAGRAGRSVLIFSLEMPKKQIAARLVCSHALVDMKKLKAPGKLPKRDRDNIRKSASRLAKLPIFVDDSNVTPVELRTKARRFAREHQENGGIGLLILDYIQLMRSDGARRYENRNLEVADISRQLKMLAMELEVPVMAVSQLSRRTEQRGGASAEPTLSDLRDSGALEQDADLVLLLHPDKKAEEQQEPQEPESKVFKLIVGKNRNGPTGDFKLAWLGKFTRFSSLDHDAYRSTDSDGESSRHPDDAAGEPPTQIVDELETDF